MARILLVDDDPSIRETLKELINFEGNATDVAVDGSEALKRIKENSYDLVILDRNMPIMSGIEVLQAVRASPKYKDLKIIMLTSASVTKEIDEAYAAGANGYVLKPIDIPQFAAKIKNALKK